MFRCPCCAVVWKLKLTNGHALLTHPDMTKWYIVKEPITLYSKFHSVPTNLVDLASHLKEQKLQLLSRGDHYMECPSCQCWSTFEAWHKAWNVPGDFFDSDQLCHCGGELWWDKIPGSNRYAHVCEKCGWIRPRAVISGHE